jgi:hypothetical protein
VEAERQETEAERSDRNWSDLVQELRVAQTGVQVLAGFLLTLPFTASFFHISESHRLVYLIAFSLAVVTVALMTAPVALHRFLFGRHEKDVLVRVGAVFAKTGMAVMGLTLISVVVLIFGVVVNDVAAVVAGVLAFAVYALVWVLIPVVVLHRTGQGMGAP